MVSVSTVTAGLLQNVVENNNAENLDVMVSFVRFVQNLEKKMVKKKTAILVKNREPSLLSSTGVGPPQ